VKLKTKKKILRWLGFVTIGIVVIAAGAWWLVNARAQREFDRRYEVSLTLSVPRPTDANEVAEGRRLARLTGCTHCHGENLAGAVPLDIPKVARFVAPNLTTMLPDYGDAQLVALLRRGVKRDGSGAWFMPSEMYRHLHDEDIARISAWIRMMPSLDGVTEATEFRPLGKLIIAKGDFRSAAEEIRRLEKAGETRMPPGRGAYLVMSLCSECHGQNLAGRPEAENAPPLAVAKGYSLEQFSRLLREGEAIGDRPLKLMRETARTRFSHLTTDEVDAMYAFLKDRG
jgi:cytochrome c553